MTPRSKPVYVIAEAGVNHNGRLSLAKRLVDIAAECGADAVKFQSFRAAELTSARAVKAPYQTNVGPARETQAEMLKQLELSERAQYALSEHCKKRGVTFLSTPFDLTSLAFLVERIRVPKLKIASGEITNGPLLLAASRTGKPIILSTGMSDFDEIQAALGVLAFGFLADKGKPDVRKSRKALESEAGQAALCNKVTLLQCTTEYPAPYDEINLHVLHSLSERFRLPVGLSDHSLGIEVPIAAAALGAAVIEKHFTVCRDLPGPDHKASLEPNELRSMIRAIRNIEKALGSPVKRPTKSERKNIPHARKSLVALGSIRKGEPLSEANLGVKRPGGGVSPLRYWDLLGKPATRDYELDDLIRA